jgi:uncharacterized membrane protein YhiD involved in acid resistance
MLDSVANVLKVDLNPAQIILSFLLAFALSYLWATVYRKTHSGISYTRSFFLTIIMMAPAVAMVMMAIGSNVALSLGLVGALSVIRFRTVIKDPKDMLYLFVSIGIGLTAGANAWMVGIIGTVIVSVMAVVLNRAGYDRAGSSDYILIFRSPLREPWSALPAEAQELVAWRQLRSATDIDSGSDFEYTYSVRLAPRVSPERIVGELTNGSIRQVTMIAPENHLDL